MNKKQNYTASIAPDDLYSEIMVIQKALDNLKAKVLSIMPPREGSPAWWDREDKKALEDIRAGKGITVSSIEELKQQLHV